MFHFDFSLRYHLSTLVFRRFGIYDLKRGGVKRFFSEKGGIGKKGGGLEKIFLRGGLEEKGWWKNKGGGFQPSRKLC